MAHSNQAKKRIRQNEKRRIQNKSLSSRMRTEVKRVLQLCETGDKSAALAQMPTASKLLDKAARQHVIHANAAARKKSRLMAAIARVSA